MSDKVKASEYKCWRCDAQAEFFVGLNDPDATRFPMCEKHAKEWRIETLVILGDFLRKRTTEAEVEQQ